MWGDRFSVDRFGGGAGGGGQSSTASGSSTPASRPYSPAPRRTPSNAGPYANLQARGAHTPRASTLSLVSNDSSTSLLASSRKANGSNLKQSTTVDEDDSGAAALETLEKLLGMATLQEKNAKSPGRLPPTSHSITDADLSLDVDFAGQSLRSWADGRDEDAAARRVYRPQTMEEYETEKTKFEELHRSISACNDVLGSVEANLTSFRNDLAAVSADIETLQSRSTSLNIRLENRKAVEKALGPVVEELSVSPIVVQKIAEGPIDEAWVKMLAEVDRRAAAYRSNTSGPRQSKAWRDMGPLLEKLVVKATERIRDFLVAQIKALRSPHINAQIIQQQNFLRHKELYAFLHKHHATIAEEICQAYMNTMRWYYLNQFTRYQRALDKIKLHIIDKNDLLGHEELSRKATILSSSSSSSSSSKTMSQPHDAFNLGRRIDLLRTNSQAALSSYVAEEDKAMHYLEVPFRNFNLALIDNASAEYTFLATFFSPPLSLARVAKHFNYIFEPTFALGQQLTRSLVGETYDALALLLCIRLNQHLAFELQRRKVPAVDGYVNATNMLLWPRLQVVMDYHCESVRQLTNALPSRAPSSAKAAAEQARLLSAAPHVVTQRFGQLLHGILALSTEAGDDEPVVTSLRRLRSEVESFLTRHSQAFGNDKRKRERFLYNNYSLVLTIIGDVEGKLAVEQQEHFESLKAAFQEGA